jgi:hypothetical protein
MPRGGARAGAGRRKNKPENHGNPTKLEAREIIENLGKPIPNWHAKSSYEPTCNCWKCLWKKDAEQQNQVGQYARKYLWDRDSGKPVDTVNHVHDKPIDLNVNVSMAEIVRKVRLRKQEYERTGTT